MIIRRVEVRNFRKLVQPVAIDGLTNGLTIVVGENEEGKSTLLQAVRSAFFDKHKLSGARAKSFQPYSSNLRPEITISFELQGKDYTLFKAFCQHPEVELTTPAGKLTDAPAEEELAKLLRFTPPKKSSSDTSNHEHEGIYGMFWVEQGKSFQGVTPTQDGRMTIQQALGSEVGNVLGGHRGQRIMDRIQKIRNEILTSGGKPKGDYKYTVEKSAEMSQKLRDVESRIENYESQLKELESAVHRLERYKREQTLEKADTRAQTAEAAWRKLQQIEKLVEDKRLEVRLLEAELENHNIRLEARKALISSIGTSKERLESLTHELGKSSESLKDLGIRVRAGAEILNEASESWDRSKEILRVVEATQQVTSLRRDLERLQKQKAAAIESRDKQELHRRNAAAISIEKNDLHQLEKLSSQVLEFQAKVSTLATNITLDLASGHIARMDECDDLETGKEYRLTEPTTIEIPGCATVRVIPGGGIGNPRKELKKAESSLKDKLAELAISSVEQASELFQSRQAELNRSEEYGRLFAASCPEGLEIISSQIASIESELTGLENISLRSAENEELPIARARELESQAQLNWKKAEADANENNRQYSLAENREALITDKLNSERNTLMKLERQLSQQQAGQSDFDLARKMELAAEAASKLRDELRITEARLELLNPEAVRLELGSAKDALVQLRKEMGDVEFKRIRLEGQLSGIGAQGLFEEKDRLEADLQTQTAIRDQLERRSQEADLLLSLLMEAEQTARETYLKPVVERVRPYLKLLLPGTEISLTEDLEIRGIERGGVVEQFESLSLGTREQLAVLTRLAFADLLREKGRPAPVLLDDAIVYADDERFNRMLHILRKASEQIQIIVLTCRERDYEAAGAPIIRMSEAKSPARSASGI